MHARRNLLRRGSGLLGLCLLGFAFSLTAASQASAAELPPYEFNASLSLTGGCTTSKADPVPDPGCPEKKPPSPFAKPLAIAIDSFGDEYVASFGEKEGANGRIDVFSPKGVYITEITPSLAPKSLAVDGEGNLYVFEVNAETVTTEIVRYSPNVYKPAEEKIEYGKRSVINTFSSPSVGGVAVDDSNGHLFVAHGEKIDEYSSALEGNKLEKTITNERLESTKFVAVDAQRRRLYASSCPTGDITKCWILVFNLDKPTEILEEVKGPNPPEEVFLSGKGWISIAVDEETGDFFVGDLELTKNVYQFNENYELVSTLKQNPELFEGGEPMQIALSNAKSALNHEYLFVPSLKNRALAYSPPKCQAPIVERSLASVAENEAELQALVRPKGCVTTYRIEYLSQQEYEEAGETFTGAKVVGEGTIQPTEQETEVKAAIGGLSPETEYRFRVVAENESGGAEQEATFTTYNDVPISNACENQALRLAHSALLPDCRAYELVTPADTNGRPPRGLGAVGDQFTTLEASPAGNAVSFITEGGVIPGLGGTGSFNGDPYRTTRSGSGWTTESAGPNGDETTSVNPGSTSPDQGYSFWTATREGSAVVEGLDTHYVRYPDGHSALVGRGEVEGEERSDPRAEGKLITENGTHIVFETKAFNGKQPIQLEPEAPPTGTKAVYDRTADEVTHVVSIRPDGKPFVAGQNAEYIGASPDGEGIAFSVGNKLYLRLDNAKTFELGEGLEFAGISEEGRRIFYLKGGNLIAFDTAEEKEIPFTNTGNAVPVNVSADGTRAYFVSTTAIAGAGPNPNGAFAKKGQQNLYLSEEGTIRFVGTVTARDVEGELTKIAGTNVDGLGLWTVLFRENERRSFARDPSRTTLNGSVLLFSSRANLDGYAHENVPEIYRYDSVSERLHCISCIPTKTPAGGGATLETYTGAPGVSGRPMEATVLIPNLTANGMRAIFESREALVSRDNDGVQDVYEWEEQGVGNCTRAGGCVYLISSGESASDNLLYGVSSSGDDLFFFTNDVLVGGDNNTLSIYDARVGGGFPEPSALPCLETDKCRGAASPPPSLPPATSEGLGRLEEVPPVKHCPKGKHKATRHGKKVCVKNKKHHRKHHKTKKGAGK